MRQSNINEFFPPKQGIVYKNEDSIKQTYSSQPFLERHSYCDENCLDFNDIIVKDELIWCLRKKCPSLPLDQCPELIRTFQEKHIARKQKKEKPKRNATKYIKRKSVPLTLQQRKEISFFQSEGLKSSVIAYFMRITPGQVRMNKTILQNQQLKQEIFFTEEMKTWLKKESSQSSNSSTFNAAMFLNKFKNVFNLTDLSVYQFRKMLHSIKIYYRVPSLKPFHYFKKKSRVEEVHRYITEICGYLKRNYKIVFIDECSFGSISRMTHKQWYLQGSFKQSLERIGTNTFVIAAMGEDDFLFFQIIEGTGKAFIFQHFCRNLLKKAEEHYKDSNFIFVMDNATIHKNEIVNPLLEQILHVFTPPYRPDMNGIEHMFAWIKRYITKEQPVLFGAFQQTIHKAFSKIDQPLIASWTGSIYKHMFYELQLLQLH